MHANATKIIQIKISKRLDMLDMSGVLHVIRYVQMYSTDSQLSCVIYRGAMNDLRRNL